jgi:polar amino acid transport system substrate-binding protein/arginine transport system substrate-binding protein/lysine/arginine/ornithine transport system substrate-binding protein/histidine transport system substrate-binding protein
VKRHAVCVVGKTSQAEWLAGQVADRPDQAVPFATVREVFEGLRAGRCTLALMPTANALEFLTGDQGVGFDYYGPPLDAPSLGGSVHIIFPPGRSDLRDVVDEAVERLMMDGSYRTLISRFFPFDIL